MAALNKDNVLPRTLLIGGAGFLGSHFCDRLIGAGHEVICMDNLLTGNFENIRHLLSNARFTFVCHDMTKPIDLEELLKDMDKKRRPAQGVKARLDYIVHLAAPASPKDYEKYPIHTLKIGALGTHHAVGMAKRYKSVFLLTSTSEVYGDPEVNPQPETYWGRVNPVGPRSVYDEAKRYAEAMAMAYHREHGVQVRIARIFNTYGERMRLDDGRAIPNFVSQALQGKPLTIYGNGKQTRSFCYVSDLIEGLYRLLLSQEVGPINLGNPHEITLLELAQTIMALSTSKSRLVFKPLPVDDPVQRKPDISRATKILGWHPKMGLLSGINQVLPYFQAQIMNRWLHQPRDGWRSPFHGYDERVVQNN